MPPLSIQNIESELSYAYLHAVASRAGMSCQISNRHLDNSGVDATIVAWGPFPQGGYISEVTINVQLKATTHGPADNGDSFSYFLKGLKGYDYLREETYGAVSRILIVFFLPSDPETWLIQSEEELILRRCAYWVSLRGAPASKNSSGITIKLPKKQILDVPGLEKLAVHLSRPPLPPYES